MYNPDAILSRPLFSHLKALEVVRHQIWEQLKEVCISAWIHASHVKQAPELPKLQYGAFNTTTSQDACVWQANHRLTLTEVM